MGLLGIAGGLLGGFASLAGITVGFGSGTTSGGSVAFGFSGVLASRGRMGLGSGHQRVDVSGVAGISGILGSGLVLADRQERLSEGRGAGQGDLGAGLHPRPTCEELHDPDTGVLLSGNILAGG